MSTNTELAVVPPKETALTVFTTEKGLEPWLQQIRTKVDLFKLELPELTTQKGRDRYASMAHQIAKSKTALEAVGKQLSAEQKEVPKKIDAERKRVWDTLESWQKEVRKPLDDWQEEEDKRVAQIKADIEKISDLARSLDGVTAEDLEDRIKRVESVAIADKWAEFQVDAALAKEQALTALYTSLTNRKVYEADQAELAQRRADDEARAQRDREEQIRKEATDKANREAEEKAVAQRESEARRIREEQADAQKREDDLKLQVAESERRAEQSRREKIEAEQSAERERLASIEREKEAAEKARQAELDRQAAAVAYEAEQVAAREADKEHKKTICLAAQKALIAGGIDEEVAKAVIILIHQRKVPAVSIAY